MDIDTTVLLFITGYLMYTWGKASAKKLISDKVIDSIVAQAKVPIGIVEQIEGHYYVYEKDTTNFLGQAASLEDLPKKLLENKISLALLMYPEQSTAIYWCINGKLKAVIQ